MMEKFKSFEYLASEQGGTVTPWNPSEEFMREFEEYMEKSVRESRRNAVEAWKSAANIFINL
jgi:hypothetical protein